MLRSPLNIYLIVMFYNTSFNLLIMTKKINWRKNDILSIKINSNLFTIAQMLEDPYLIFFRISNKDGSWTNIDLNTIPQLFSVAVARDFINNKIESILKEGVIYNSTIKLPQYWIRPKLNFSGGYPFKGGHLIALDPINGSSNSPIIKKNLTLSEDKETIGKYELINIWGSEDLTDRLQKFFNLGIEEDSLKEKIFSI